MSFTGVIIDDVDTMRQWGLVLLDDLKIGEAKYKSSWVDIPGADGAVNMSTALTDGVPVFEMRTVSFTLFAAGFTWDGNTFTRRRPPNEEQVNLIRTQLMALCQGKEVQLWLPDDTTHYFRAVMSVGDKSGFNSGRIPVTAKVWPYRLKNESSLREVAFASAETKTVTVTNEQMRTTPAFIATGGTVVRKGNNTWAIDTGVRTTIPELVFEAGETELQLTAGAGTTVYIMYQEGRL